MGYDALLLRQITWFNYRLLGPFKQRTEKLHRIFLQRLSWRGFWPISNLPKIAGSDSEIFRKFKLPDFIDSKVMGLLNREWFSGS